tara:strand:+ start:8227 stop:8697 length:471 start_codon:yes stop_codon:yes gene_type:complete
MSKDNYNGWANRETWCFNMYLRNDRQLYHLTKKAAVRGMREADDFEQKYSQVEPTGFEPTKSLLVGQSIMRFMESLHLDMIESVREGVGFMSSTDDGLIVHAEVSKVLSPESEVPLYIDFKLIDLVSMFHDIGSLNRVDLGQIANGWIEDLEEVDA